MMLKKEHIAWYREDIQRARLVALGDIETAESFAREMKCSHCFYCNFLFRHKEVLEHTVAELTALVDSLSEGAPARLNFPKTMTHETMLYRGFITDIGDYAPVYQKMDHSQYREEYARKYGEDRAYRMINIHGHGMKTKVIFCDRKAPPNASQLSTLRELMIDAEGGLSFCFLLDTKHPSAHSPKAA